MEILHKIAFNKNSCIKITFSRSMGVNDFDHIQWKTHIQITSSRNSYPIGILHRITSNGNSAFKFHPTNGNILLFILKQSENNFRINA